MERETKPTPEPCECTVTVMEAPPAADVTRLLKLSKATLLVRGFIFLIFGLLLMLHPVGAITTIILFLGVYVLFEGFAMFRSAFVMPPAVRPLWITNAMLLLLLGIISLFAPRFMGEWAIIMFGIWQLLSGLQCLLLPARHGRQSTSFSGVLSILAGLFFIGMPVFGLMAFTWLFAALFFFSGVLMLIAGSMLR